MAGIRVYADTSVYDGVFDEEFAEASRTFFDQVRQGRFRLVLSPIVADELEDAPDPVWALFEELRRSAETADVSEETVRLQPAYLDANVVASKVGSGRASRGRRDGLPVPPDRKLEFQAHRELSKDSALCRR